MELLAPFKLAPYFSPRPWGFDDLAPWFDKKVTDGSEPIGEAWLTGAKATVASGKFTGRSFADVVRENADAILGPKFAAEGEYPLLIKVLFPKEKLSVQVHPDDVLAQKKGEPRGKTECWYVLEAKPDAKVALGLQPGVTDDQIRSAIDDQTLENLLGWVDLKVGDMIFVDAGTVHAIWPGSVILETQQTSDTTYRLYDYGRPRPLHIEESLEAMRLHTRAGRVTPQSGSHGESVVVNEQYFRVERWDGDGAGVSAAAVADQGPQLLFVANGSARIEGPDFEPITLGRCELAVIPANAQKWELRGEAQVMRIVPQDGSAL